MQVILLLTLFAGDKQGLATVGEIGVGQGLLYKCGLSALQKAIYHINWDFICHTIFLIILRRVPSDHPHQAENR